MNRSAVIGLTVVMLSHFCGLASAEEQEPPIHGLSSPEENKPRSRVPTPRAAHELEPLTAFSSGVGNNGQVELPVYLALASPFGALDLQVTHATDGDEASFLKNYYLGMCGRILKIDTGKIASSFHCGPECTQQRKEIALKKLQAIRELVNIFLKAQNIFLVAQGFHPERFRINNTFVLGGWVRESIPSPNMGFIPSGQWNEFRNLDQYYEKSQINRSDATRLVEGLMRASFVALEKTDATTARVFLTGIGDNVAGFLFQDRNKPVPMLREKSTDGLEYVVLEELESGLWYFETT